MLGEMFFWARRNNYRPALRIKDEELFNRQENHIMKLMKFKSWFSLLIVFMGVQVFALSETHLNNPTADSILNSANSLSSRQYKLSLFSKDRIKYFKNEKGEMFYSHVRYSNKDSSGYLSFYAVKSINWDNWKVTINKSIMKNRSDSKRDSLFENIDSIVISGIGGMSKKELLEKDKKLKNENIILNEINYWEEFGKQKK